MPSVFVPLVSAHESRDKTLIPLCVPRWFLPHLVSYAESLSETPFFTGSEAAKLEAMYDTEDALAIIMTPGGCAGVTPDLEEYCNEYAPNSYILEYAPNDPFQTPDLTPPGYIAPPWKSYQDNFPAQLAGIQAGDAVMGLWTTAPNNWWETLPFSQWYQTIVNLPGLVESGFPRFRVNFSGRGVVELHLLQIPLGGVALITLDGQIDDKTQLIETASYNLSSIASLNEIIEAVLGSVVTDDKLVQEIVIEVPIETDGNHHIDVTFLPNVDIAGDMGWGGGLRKVVLCRENIQGVANNMPQFRVNQTNLTLEWKPNELTQVWEPLGQVIYPIHMQANQDTLQWTLQAIPIGGGANPFEQWLDLVTVQDGIDGQPAPTPIITADSSGGEYKLAFDMNADGTPELTTPNLLGADGQDGIDGQPAPPPIIAADSSGGEYKLRFDMNADGTPELTTPNLLGQDGANGQPGQPGQNAPIPTFQWDGTLLKIDANSDGIFDYTSPDLKGEPGAVGDCDCLPTPLEVEHSQLAHVCAGVNGFIDAVWDKLAAAKAELIQVQTEAQSIGNAIMNVFNALTLNTYSFLPLDDIYYLAQSWVAFENAVWTTVLFDVDLKNDFKKELFCRIANNNSQLTESIWSDFITNLPYTEPPQSPEGEIQRDFVGQTFEKMFFRVASSSFEIFALNEDNTCEAAWFDCLPQITPLSGCNDFDIGIGANWHFTSVDLPFGQWGQYNNGEWVNSGGKDTPGCLKSQITNTQQNKSECTVVVDFGEQRSVTAASFWTKANAANRSQGYAILCYNEQKQYVGAMLNYFDNLSTTTYSLKSSTATVHGVRYLVFSTTVNSNDPAYPAFIDNCCYTSE